MITLVEALRFRCLRYVSQPLGGFHVLVGPNASGKTTFLDVIALLGKLVSDGLEAAINERASSVTDLLWKHSGNSFELAVEARIPGSRRQLLPDHELEFVRYEVALGLDPGTQELSILAEKVLLKGSVPEDQNGQRELFPQERSAPDSLLTPKASRATKTVVNKVPGGNDNYYAETKKGWAPAFKLGPRKSAFANLPDDESNFPVSTWFKGLLVSGVQEFVLNSRLIRLASPPGQVRGFKPDGSNLPWVIDGLQSREPDRFRAWVAHLQTALPDIEDIRTVVREDDRHRYLVLRYSGGLEVPSWMASDGTLRLLALTLPAYLPAMDGVYLIEEPENGIHPRAVETVCQSLSSVYDAQILLATHSPVILNLVKPGDVLCFAKTPEGATDIVSGADHPALRDWRGQTSLSTLFAAGVLG